MMNQSFVADLALLWHNNLLPPMHHNPNLEDKKGMGLGGMVCAQFKPQFGVEPHIEK